MELIIQQGFIGLEKIESEWNQLFNKLAYPLYSQSIIWHKAYLRNLMIDSSRCYYFCIYKNNKLIAVFPLENNKKKFLKTLSFSDTSHFGFNLNSILIDEYENTQIVFEFLFQSLKKEKSIKWDVIYLKRVLDNSQYSLCKTSDSKLTFQTLGSSCDILPIQNYKKTHEMFSRNFKRNLQKSRKKILGMENVKFESSQDIETLEDYFNYFLDVEASGWKGLKGSKSAIKLNGNVRNFYQEAMRGFAKNGQMEINLLSINNKPIAAQFAIIIEPTVFLLKIGYDENSRRISPGNILLEHKLKEYEVNPNLTILNLISNADWHTNWKPNVLLSHNIYNCKNLFIARNIKLLFWLEGNVKKILSKL